MADTLAHAPLLLAADTQALSGLSSSAFTEMAQWPGAAAPSGQAGQAQQLLAHAQLGSGPASPLRVGISPVLQWDIPLIDVDHADEASLSTTAASAATGMAPPATGGASSSATPSAAATAPACCPSHGACCCSRCRGRCNSGTVKHRHRVGDGGTANAALGKPVATGTASHKVATWSKDDLARSIHANAALV